MLDHESPIPLYYQLKEVLEEKIKEGTWKEGDKVPSEKQLMEIYSVSRATVRKALSELMTDGLIFTKQGSGTFVSKSKIIQNLIGELSFNREALRQGLIPSSKVIHQSLEKKLPKRISELFELNSSDEVHKIIRVRAVNENPLILETLFIPSKYGKDILKQDLSKIAIFEYLENECNLEFTYSTLEIVPVVINEFEAKYLDTEVGKLALSMERIIYSNENVIAIQKRIMRGDKGKFSLFFGNAPKNRDDYKVGIEFI